MVMSDFSITFINATEATLRFRVQNFSKMKGPRFSPPCYVLNIPWRIMIMARALLNRDMGWSKRYLGYFLQCNADSRSNQWSCYAIGDLTLIGVRPQIEPYRKTIRHIFNAKRNNYGFKFFMLWDDILDTNNGYIEDDAITLELHLITEAPKNMGILYNWGDYSGRIFVPKQKWSDAGKSLSKKNSKFVKENSSVVVKEEKLVKAEELFELLHQHFSPFEMENREITAIRQLSEKIEEEIEDECSSTHNIDSAQKAIKS